ncbi:MAG TPA: hypothetical protein DIS94_03400 [Bacteroidetes bacterium]|nr:hypothetical protein [Bacteroidota bacterium]
MGVLLKRRSPFQETPAGEADGFCRDMPWHVPTFPMDWDMLVAFFLRMRGGLDCGVPMDQERIYFYFRDSSVAGSLRMTEGV